MEQLIVILTILVVCSFISIIWVNGIDYMQKNHPDYRGEDLFGEDEKNNDLGKKQ